MIDTGYSITECVLSPDECDTLTAALNATIHIRSRAGARHLMGNRAVAEPAHDPRLTRIAAEILGGSAVPYRATLFEKSGVANWLVPWHQDTALPLAARFDDAEWGPWSMKARVHYALAPAWALQRVVALRVHLDASTSDNGPLRVIPGSHAFGLLSDDDVHELSRREPAVSCLVERGGVLAMRPLLLHASSKVRIDLPRRVLHIEYADSLELSSNAHLALA